MLKACVWEGTSVLKKNAEWFSKDRKGQGAVRPCADVVLPSVNSLITPYDVKYHVGTGNSFLRLDWQSNKLTW